MKNSLIWKYIYRCIIIKAALNLQQEEFLCLMKIETLIENKLKNPTTTYKTETVKSNNKRYYSIYRRLKEYFK